MKSKIKLYSLMKKLNLQNKKVFGVGSPSRGATLVNYTGLNEDLLKCILEVKRFLQNWKIYAWYKDTDL